MYHGSWPLYRLVLPLLLSPVYAGSKGQHNNDPDLFHFVTRPELKAPKWEIEVYHETELSDGYWFIGAKPGLERTIGSGQGWFGPAIYDGKGELVWSGASQLDTPNVMDFRISDVKGERLISMCDRDRTSGVFLDNEYEIRNMVLIDDPTRDVNINGHEFNVVDNGASALVVQNHKKMASKEEEDAVGYTGGKGCEGNYMSFNDLNLTSGKSLFDWDSYGRILLNESTMTEGSLTSRCENGWDFIHANSADKTPDGHYLLSARHTDTIYKVSKDDGSIIWRLGGKQPDFEMGDVKFSRQHDIRCRGQNETHTILSMLDNAIGQHGAKPTHPFSRGLLIALRTDTTPMQASLIAVYDHPKKNHVNRRGNMHIMDNGNIFMGWSERAFQSEHAPDGKILMQARLKTKWLGTYRNYKFPFVGRPSTRPDVSAVAYMRDWNSNVDNPITQVYVSWNGDTEVATWNFYGTTAGSDKMELIDSAERAGFETYFEYKGYAKSVSLEGVDKNGEVIGKSGTVKTIPHPTMPEVSTAFAEDKTLVVCKNEESKETKTTTGFFGHPPVVFMLGCVCSAGVLILGWTGVLPLVTRVARARGLIERKENVRYEKVAGDDQDQDDPLSSEELRTLNQQGISQDALYSDKG